ncbi:MAG TPA: LysR family transcriptional regulator [Solirubrobacteraceae bacterium]|nr:LysR family transcriptional regulator [Solirubrobacteraceae bacterium]
MNLQQLRYFLEAADTGSFTLAARRLHVAQPSLSQQIRALEAELGGELIERLPRVLRLTAAGEAFLPKARAAVRAADDAAGLARRAIAAGPDNICLAVTPAIAPRLIAAALVRCAAGDGPQRDVCWRDYDSQARAEEKVANNGVGTVGLGVRPATWSGPVVALSHDDFVVAGPPEDELAGLHEPIALGALAERTWIGIEPEREGSDIVDAAYAAAGFLPREPHRAGSAATALQLVAAGLGLALVPRAALVDGSRVAVVELEQPPRRELVAFTDQPWTPAAIEFLTALTAVMADDAFSELALDAVAR